MATSGRAWKMPINVFCCSRICDQRGLLVCTGCHAVAYCSPECQVQHWSTTHKDTCLPNLKFNCFIIRTKPKSGPLLLLPFDKDRIPDQVEPLPLSQTARMTEALQDRLGWKRPRIIGKFFDHRGSDSWFYICVSNERSEAPKTTNSLLTPHLATQYAENYDNIADAASSPGNTISSLVCDTLSRGDIAIVRTGPPNGTFNRNFSKKELCKTLVWYINKRAKDVRLERERSWAKKMGTPLPFDEEEHRMWVRVPSHWLSWYLFECTGRDGRL